MKVHMKVTNSKNRRGFMIPPKQLRQHVGGGSARLGRQKNLERAVILRSSSGPEHCEGIVSRFLKNNQSGMLRCAQDDCIQTALAGLKPGATCGLIFQTSSSSIGSKPWSTRRTTR